MQILDAMMSGAGEHERGGGMGGMMNPMMGGGMMGGMNPQQMQYQQMGGGNTRGGVGNLLLGLGSAAAGAYARQHPESQRAQTVAKLGQAIRRYGGGSNNGLNLNNILSTYGDMAFLPAAHVNHHEMQMPYQQGTVDPIIPYNVPNQYTGGKVRGLFIGCNYIGTQNELNGCINDVAMILGTLEQIQFPLQEASILVDDPKFKGSSGPPTRNNILLHFKWLVHDAKPGDVFFFHYSGHGSQQKNMTGDEESGMDDTMVPVDFERAGCIIDDDVKKMLVRPLPQGARMTAVMDCCHSATIMDLPFELPARSSLNLNDHNISMRANMTYNPNDQLADTVLFSGCPDDKTSADVTNTTNFGNQNKHGKGVAGGACTNAMSYVLTHSQNMNYLQLLMQMRGILNKRHIDQVPQLSASKNLDLTKTFSLFGPITASNREIQMEQPSPELINQIETFHQELNGYQQRQLKPHHH